MLRILQTWDGHNINDGISYKAVLLNPYALPSAQPVFVAQAMADAEDTGTYTVEPGTLAIDIKIVNYANRLTLIAQLQQWFKRGTQGSLVALFTDDSLSYSKACRVVNLVQDPDHPLHFYATLHTGWTTWRAVTPDTYNWNLSGTGGNHTVELAGDDETPLSVTFSLSAGPTSGYLYQRLYQLIAAAGVPAMGLDPWCITMDTAALVSDDSNKCQINQGGGINNSVTTIPYDTVTGVIPSAGMGYVDTEQIRWTGKTGTTSGNLTGVTRGYGGTTAASHADNAVIRVSSIQANCADVRVFVDGREVNRWIPNPNNANSKIWFNINMTQPGYSLALGTAIVSTADVSTITFADTPDVYAAIAALPTDVILVHGTEWILCRRTESGPKVRRLDVLQRGLMGTTRQTHAAGDLFQFMEHVVTVCYGNVVAARPETLNAHYDDTKPLFNLTSSTNASWVYDATTLFYDAALSATDAAHPDRTGGFKPAILERRSPKNSYPYYVKQGAVSGDPAMGMLIAAYHNGLGYVPDKATIVWTFYRACGLDTTTFTGQKRRGTVNWPVIAALEKSVDGSIYTSVWNEATPSVINTWEALAAHSGVSIGSARWIRFDFSGTFEAAGQVYVAFEIQTGTITFVSANLPTGSLLSPAQNAQLELTLTNGANEDAFDTNVPMLIGLTLALDADERTILYNKVNAHDGILLNNEARDWWIRLQPGNNALTVTATDVGTLLAVLSWQRRRF